MRAFARRLAAVMHPISALLRRHDRAATRTLTMNSVQPRISKKRPQILKTSLQIKVIPKPQATGLSREEIRQIVLEMIG
jgi:hypothetical protein